MLKFALLALLAAFVCRDPLKYPRAAGFDFEGLQLEQARSWGQILAFAMSKSALASFLPILVCCGPSKYCLLWVLLLGACNLSMIAPVAWVLIWGALKLL